jgi:serine phosphatase RsbU (regulator of sigma subunit)
MSQLLSELSHAPAADAKIDFVRQIQSTFGPERCYAWPGARVAVKRVASVGFGGDFHAVTHWPDEQHSIVVGTVHGPGLVAALAKAVISGAIRKIGPVNRSPIGLLESLCDLLDRLNADLSPRAVTCSIFHGLFDCTKGTLGYCTAGRVRPYVRTRDGALQELSVESAALERSADIEPRSGSLELSSIERLLVHTEGLCEVCSSAGEPFGPVQSRQLLSGTAFLPVDRQLAAVVEAVHSHADAISTLTDDVTLFAAEFTEEATSTPCADAVSDLFKSYEESSGFRPDSSVFLG